MSDRSDIVGPYMMSEKKMKMRQPGRKKKKMRQPGRTIYDV